MQEERFGTRDLSYSAWHRRGSIRRYVGIEVAQTLAMVDIDCVTWLEMDDGTREPLALIETARDVGQREKPASATANLARLARLPAFCVLYRLSPRNNPAAGSFRVPDIDGFRVKRLWPRPEFVWRSVTPSEWANALVAIRRQSAALLDRAESQAEYRVLSVENEDARQLELIA